MLIDHHIDQLYTVGDWWRYGVSRFREAGLSFGHGCVCAVDEVSYTILHVLHFPLDTPIVDLFSCRLVEEEQRRIAAVFQDRINSHRPMAYIVREAWLQDWKFYVDERVIIPRSFIAELLPLAFHPWIEYPELVHSALDLCTGSGCLAVLMSHYFPDAQIDAVDLSSDALDVARVNVERYGLGDRIHLHESDLFSELNRQGGKIHYDLIVVNPPYVDAHGMYHLPKEYHHEPRLALEAGGRWS